MQVNLTAQLNTNTNWDPSMSGQNTWQQTMGRRHHHHQCQGQDGASNGQQGMSTEISQLEQEIQQLQSQLASLESGQSNCGSNVCASNPSQGGSSGMGSLLGDIGPVMSLIGTFL
jgi:hypothetical protein